MLFLRSYKKVAGFSLLEVLITSAIIGIITAIAMVRYGSFNSAVLLQNQAYEIALDIREAQTFAVSVQGEGGQFREEFGLFFDVAPIVEKTRYRFWQDNGSVAPAVYNTGEQIGGFRILDSRFEIKEICYNGNSNCDATFLHISFARPNFDANLNAGGVGVVSSATIVLTNVLDQTKTVGIKITSTGQISVE